MRGDVRSVAAMRKATGAAVAGCVARIAPTLASVFECDGPSKNTRRHRVRFEALGPLRDRLRG